MLGLCRGQWLQVAAVTALAVLAACGPDAGSGDDGALGGATIADGWTAEVVRTGLQGPTQIVLTDEGRLLVAQLAGGENAGTGQVLDLGVDAAAEDPEVLLTDLDKPTGIAAVGGDLLVQTPGALLRFEDGAVEGVPVVEGLPSNGRSQGTLTPLPDGRIAFEASGTGSGPRPREGSGVLYAIAADAAPGTQPDVLATGFKGAYAHAVSAAGDLWVTELGDGTYDGEPPPDELNLVALGDVPVDAGWPVCVGTRSVEEFADLGSCDGTLAPFVEFAPRATPTSVVELPDGTVLVALWVEDRVVAVDPATGAVSDVLTDVANPQHLLVAPDGAVWLTVHAAGELWRLTPPA